jgi:hypothetical protein
VTTALLVDVATAAAWVAVLMGNGFLTLALFLSRPSVCASVGRAPLEPSPPDRIGSGPSASVAVVRPLYGPDLSGGRNNASLLAQRIAGGVEFVFVASRQRDPGLMGARAAHGADRRASFLVSESLDDTTDKAAGMAAGWRATTAPFVAFCDADVHLDPDDLAACLALFDADDVAGVFAPVLHVPTTGLQRLLAMVASGDKIVTVRALEGMGHLRLMEGGLMVLRREALEAAGSIEVLRETVADDLRLAAVLTAAGFRLRAGPVIRHAQESCGAAELARQYHRWMLCQRVESPRLLVVQLGLHAVVAPLAAWALHPTSVPAATLLAFSLLWRIAVTAAIERTHLRPHGVRLGWWVLLRPLADLLHVAACVAAFAVPSVRWGERTYRFKRRTHEGGPASGRALPSDAGLGALRGTVRSSR